MAARAGVSRQSAAARPADTPGRTGRTAAPASGAPVRTAPARTAPVGTALGRTAAPGRVRLTRRGRVVLAGLAVATVAMAALVLSLSMAGGALAASHGSPRAGYQGMRQVVVEQGQTLWSIAAAAAPRADPRVVIQQIMETNALGGSTIRAGELLWVPKH
jgi:hypothetical protein